MENLFLQKPRWIVGSFGNLVDIDPSKGTMIPIVKGDRWLNKCLTNCNIVPDKDENKCREYCRSRNHLRNHYNSYAKTACPSGDAICCKYAAQDNDFAYMMCAPERDKQTYKPNIPLTFFIFVIALLSLVFLYFLFIK